MILSKENEKGGETFSGTEMSKDVDLLQIHRKGFLIAVATPNAGKDSCLLLYAHLLL